jgi:hypothetical protein
VELYLHSPNEPSWRAAQLGGAALLLKVRVHSNLNALLRTRVTLILKPAVGPVRADNPAPHFNNLFRNLNLTIYAGPIDILFFDEQFWRNVGKVRFELHLNSG